MSWRLDELRHKPNHVKEWYALTGALVITSIITFAWLLSFSGGTSEEISKDGDTNSAISQYFMEFKSQLGQLRGAFDKEVTVDEEKVPVSKNKPNIILPELEQTHVEEVKSEPVLIEIVSTPSGPVIME